ncbi:MAG: ABC transporter permease subunit [Candidatus Heimdallarchaeota archaeon]|nr:MAG: ABC transporter permease subunit [Candidatus Heimdallarchaeota archaeon]
MAQNHEFELTNTTGRFGGLGNLLQAEFSRWRTWDWYIMAIIWVAIISFSTLGMIASTDTTITDAILILGFMIGMFPVIAVVIIMQDEIVSHRETGTIAWLLSKPVKRSSFILSKLIGNIVGVLISMVVIPGIVVYFEIVVFKGIILSPLHYMLGFTLVAINLVFYLSLTLMLGTVFEQRGGIIAIPLTLCLGYSMLMNLAQIPIHPMSMFFAGGTDESLFGALILGTPLTSVLPIISTTLFIIVFILISLRQFNKEEL